MEARFDTFTQRLDKVADRVEHLDQVVLNTEEYYDEEEEEDGMRINDDYADDFAVHSAQQALTAAGSTAAQGPTEGVVPSHGYSLRTRTPKPRNGPYA